MLCSSFFLALLGAISSSSATISIIDEYCCLTASQPQRCATSAGKAVGGTCPAGYFVNIDNYCCPTVAPCAGSAGPVPANNTCPSGFLPAQGECCPATELDRCFHYAQPAVGGKCPSDLYFANGGDCCYITCSSDAGPPINGTCPVGFGINSYGHGDRCCPMVWAAHCYVNIGGPLGSDKRCPVGYRLSVAGGCCQSPSWSCKNPASSLLDCNIVTAEMCASPSWQPILTQYCPNKCGFCPFPARPSASSCPNGGQSLGAATAGLCPVGSKVVGDICCPSPIPAICNGTAGPVPAWGSCALGFLPVKGQCCPATEPARCPTSSEPAVGGKCPVGLNVYSNGCCVPTCSADAGPPVNGSCPVGFVMVDFRNGQGMRCCPNDEPAFCSISIGNAYYQQGEAKCPVGYRPLMGKCCQIPVWSCKNDPASPLNCNTVTASMCADPQWQDVITEFCPNKCGFCPFTGY